MNGPHVEEAHPRKRPPRVWVIHELRHEDLDAPVDWSRWYVTEEDDRGETAEQGETNRLLLNVVSELAAERGWKDVYIGSDNFFQWVEDEPKVQISPDVFVVDAPPEHLPSSFQTWREGFRPPRLAVEIVSDDPKKDHDDAPDRYASLGARELVSFDPRATGRRPRRELLTLYRRSTEGAFMHVYSGPGPAYSKELDSWLVTTGSGDDLRLRVARDEAGVDLVPSTAERLAAVQRLAQAADERARAADRRARAADQRADAESRRADDLAAKVAALEAQLVRKPAG
jgi:Uma2 family endonuclease